MSETPFNFGQDLEAARRARNAKVKREQQAAEEAAQARREHGEEAVQIWNSLDKRKLAAAQKAIRQIPVEIAEYFLRHNTPFNIQKRFVTEERRLGVRKRQDMGLWGVASRTEITYEQSAGKAEYSWTVNTGKFKYEGWGLDADGREYAFAGPEQSSEIKLATPRYMISGLANMGGGLPRPEVYSALVEAGRLGEEGVDAYLMAQYDKARAAYIGLVAVCT